MADENSQFRILLLINKLNHDLSQVRERAVTSLYSKVAISGVFDIDQFPCDEFSKGIISFIEKRSTSNLSNNSLWLILQFIKLHPNGCESLSRRGGLRALESIVDEETQTPTELKEIITFMKNYTFIEPVLDGEFCFKETEVLMSQSPVTVAVPTLPEPAISHDTGNLGYYHDGWRPSETSCDRSDVRRMADMELELCTADAATRSKGCSSLSSLLLDMPLEVLLQRPHALHAIGAAIKAPTSECLRSLELEGTTRGRMFDRLLLDILDTLEILAESISLTVKRHRNVNFMGGAYCSEGALSAARAVGTEHSAIWTPMSQRHPSPLSVSSHTFASNLSVTPDTATPLSLGGATLLALRACTPLIVAAPFVSSRALALTSKLLPFLAEENMPNFSLLENTSASRVLTITRCDIALQCLLQAVDPKLLTLRHPPTRLGDPRVFPHLCLLHQLVASSTVLPISWLASDSTPCGNSLPCLVLKDAIVDVLKELAFSAAVRITHPATSADCVAALSLLRPNDTVDLASAIQLIRSTTPVSQVTTQVFTHREEWLDQWLRLIEESMNQILPFISSHTEIRALATNTIYLWVIAVSRGASIGDGEYAEFWSRGVFDVEAILLKLLQFNHTVTEDMKEARLCAPQRLKLCLLDVLARLLSGEDIGCTVREELEIIGCVWDSTFSSSLSQALTTRPIFRDIILIAIDELGQVETDLNMLENSLSLIVAHACHPRVASSKDVVLYQVGLSLIEDGSSKASCLATLQDLDSPNYHLRSLFGTTAAFRLDAAQHLISHLPPFCLTEPCQPRDVVAAVLSYDTESAERNFPTNSLFRGDSDFNQLVSLAVDAKLTDSTRAAASHQLSLIISEFIPPRQRKFSIPESTIVALTASAVQNASPPLGSHCSIENVCERTNSALDLLVALIWACSEVSRSVLSESLLSCIVPWLFTAGSPHALMRECASKAAVLLWRTLFDPLDFCRSTRLQATQVYPIGVLVAFPCPPLSRLPAALQDNISAFLSLDNSTEDDHALVFDWDARVIEFVSSEFRRRLNQSDGRELALKSWWCPQQAAIGVQTSMISASSHAELKTSLQFAVCRAVVDPSFLSEFAKVNTAEAGGWEKALAPLLMNSPTAARDYRLLETALPFIRSLVDHMNDQDRLSLVMRVVEVMVPVLDVGDPSSMGDSKPVPRHIRNHIQLLVLRVLKDLSRCDPMVSLTLISEIRLIPRLITLIAAKSNQDDTQTCRESLLLVSTIVRTIISSPSLLSSPSHVSALLHLLPDLAKTAAAALNAPRLPDSWAHKAIVRTAVDSLASLLALAVVVDALDHEGASSLLSVIVDAIDVGGGGKSRGVLHWCRRLSCDREACIRAAAFSMLGSVFCYSDTWNSINDQHEAWSLSEAIQCVNRVAVDQTEVPLVRAAAIGAVSARIAGAPDEEILKCGLSCVGAVCSIEGEDGAPPSTSLSAATSKLIVVLVAANVSNLESTLLGTGMLLMLTGWMAPGLFDQEDGDPYVAAAAATQALRLALACDSPNHSIREHLVKSTRLLDTVFETLGSRGDADWTSSMAEHYSETALLLHDLLVVQGPSTDLFVKHTPETPSFIGQRLAGIVSGIKGEQGLNQICRSALRLIVAMVAAPGWSGGISIHETTPLLLWDALSKTRVSSQILIEEPPERLMDSALCHQALTTIVDLSPDCLTCDCVEFEEMVTQLCGEIEAINDSFLSKTKGRGISSHSRSVFGTKLQCRLLLLRSLCAHAQLSPEVCFQLSCLVDRVWPLDGVGCDKRLPSCLQLLVGIIAGLAKDDETARLICAPKQTTRTLMNSGHSSRFSSSSASSASSFFDSSKSDAQHGGVGGAVRRVLSLALTPLSKSKAQNEGSKISEIISAGSAWRGLVKCAEGRLLLTNALSTLVSTLKSLVTVPRPRRKEASARIASLFQILVAASLNDAEFQHALLVTNGFTDFMLGFVEMVLQSSSTSQLSRPLNESPAQPTMRSPNTTARRGDNREDSVITNEIKELLGLLFRNLARLRGNKAKLCASPGVLQCLFQDIQSTQLKVIAASSSALWSILYNCERAKPAMRLLNANHSIENVLTQLVETRQLNGNLSMPSVERSVRHLTMVRHLLMQ